MTMSEEAEASVVLFLKRVSRASLKFTDMRLNLLQQKFAAVSTSLNNQTNCKAFVKLVAGIQPETITTDTFARLRACISLDSPVIVIRDKDACACMAAGAAHLVAWFKDKWAAQPTECAGHLETLKSVFGKIKVEIVQSGPPASTGEPDAEAGTQTEESQDVAERQQIQHRTEAAKKTMTLMHAVVSLYQQVRAYDNLGHTPALRVQQSGSLDAVKRILVFKEQIELGENMALLTDAWPQDTELPQLLHRAERFRQDHAAHYIGAAIPPLYHVRAILESKCLFNNQLWTVGLPDSMTMAEFTKHTQGTIQTVNTTALIGDIKDVHKASVSLAVALLYLLAACLFV